MTRDKWAARDLGAFICFEDEAGQGLRPPKGRTWARRGARPVVKVCGAGGGRISIAGVACYRPHLFYQLRAYRRRKGKAKGVCLERLPGPDHRRPPGSVRAGDLVLGITSTSTWPRSWRTSPRKTRNGCVSTGCPRTRPTSIPPGIRSLLKRAVANFAAADLNGLVRIVKRKLNKIQYRPHLIDGCLAATGLTLEPW